MNRRQFITRLLLSGCAAPLLPGCRPISDDSIMNPCLASLPVHLSEHRLVREAWADIDPGQVWDAHVHLLGRGDLGPDTWMNPDMLSPLHPLLYAQYRFYINASCVEGEDNLDQAFVDRLLTLLGDMPAGVKLMLLAFDYHYDEAGQRHSQTSAYYTGNQYAARVARQHPDKFEWIASVHPYRQDALTALQAAAEGGARAVKWLPPAMGMDPASPLCAPYYRKMAELDLPLLIHTGEEKAVHGANTHDYGNPLLVRNALAAGVRVIMAHCATMGESVDLDQGPDGPLVSSFSLFERLMAEPEWQGLLFGEISAINLRNRDLDVIRRIIQRREWHARLINGSDYPLPGVFPLYALQTFLDAGLISQAHSSLLIEVRRYNPLLFDFLLKRFMQVDGQGLPPNVYQSRRFFDRRS